MVSNRVTLVIRDTLKNVISDIWLLFWNHMNPLEFHICRPPGGPLIIAFCQSVLIVTVVLFPFILEANELVTPYKG